MASKGQDDVQKKEILDWIEACIGEKIPRDQPFEKVLKDGQIICRLINRLQPGSVKKIQTKGGNFVLMQNIQSFQAAVRKYGVPEEDIFMPVDLFEARNVKAVVKSLYALGRTAQNKNFDGPVLGPKMSEKCERNFSEEEIRKGRDAHLGLQMGTNVGASQAGLSMGKQRMIID